jgi:glycosyltransferase involved in cell wall biosynthesis
MGYGLSDREQATRQLRLGYLRRFPHGEVGRVIARSTGALSPMVEFNRVPLKRIEAMAYGMAVIGTELPAQADIVGQAESGVLVPLGDPNAIVRCLLP